MAKAEARISAAPDVVGSISMETGPFQATLAGSALKTWVVTVCPLSVAMVPLVMRVLRLRCLRRPVRGRNCGHRARFCEHLVSQLPPALRAIHRHDPLPVIECGWPSYRNQL